MDEQHPGGKAAEGRGERAVVIDGIAGFPVCKLTSKRALPAASPPASMASRTARATSAPPCLPSSWTERCG